MERIHTKVWSTRNFSPIFAFSLRLLEWSRREAVESFPETSSFRFVQWVLFTKAALPPDEVVKFFGGEDADEAAKPFIAVPQKKKEVFERLYERNAGRDNEMGALYAWLHNLVNNVQSPAEEPDLVPPGAISAAGARAV